MDITSEVKFDEQGLVPVIIQDWKNNQVLMLAYMNADALRMTVSSGKTHFWSRSRKQFWLKGESSGHTQEVKEILFDCDSDAVLIKVEQKVAACHTGYRSCFYRRLEKDQLKVVGEKIFDEAEVYGGGNNILNRISTVIEDRKANPQEKSYVSLLVQKGKEDILGKIMEETGELIASVLNEDRDQVIHEMADLWFHSLVLLGVLNIPLQEIYGELENRSGKSGIQEKEARDSSR